MTVSAVSSTPPADPTTPDDSTVGLTPDAFFAYCEAQMNGIDVEASRYFDQQQNSNIAKQTLNTIVGELQTETGGFTSQAECDKLTQELQTLKAQYPQAGVQIDQMINLVNRNASGGTDDIVLGNEVQQLVTQLNDLSTQMDSANQLSMIKLQSAMSAREQILQLTSNILQAVDSGDSKVIGNIHS